MSLQVELTGGFELLGDDLEAANEDLAELEAVAGQSEDEDLYAGLQCDADRDDDGSTIVVRHQRQQIQELQAALAQRDELIKSLQETLTTKGDAVQQLASQQLVLLTNISSLFKTAQAEIKRHTTQLQSCRLELVQLKAQLARAQRQPPVQAKTPKEQQHLQQQQVSLPPRQQHEQQQQLLPPPPPPGQQQQQPVKALHDISGSFCNQQLHGAQQAKQRNSNPTGTQPPQQQQHGCHTQWRVQQQPSHAGPSGAAGAKRRRSSSPPRSHISRAEGLPAATTGLACNQHKQQKQHAGADAAAGMHSSRHGSSSGNIRSQSSHNNGSTSSRGMAGHGSGAGSGSGYKRRGGNSASSSRSPGRDAGRGGSRAAAGSRRDVQRAGSPSRRQEGRQN